MKCHSKEWKTFSKSNSKSNPGVRSFSVFFLLNQRLAVYIHKCIFFFFFFFYKTLSFTYHVAEMDFDPVCYAGGSYFIHDTNLLFRLSFNDFFLCF